MNNCENCGHMSLCTRTELLHNASCSDYISEDTYNKVYQHGHEIPMYDEFHKQFEQLTCQEWLELIVLFEKYIDKVHTEWNTKYTYCTGCKKDVERTNTYTEIEDNKQIIRCKDCYTVWYVRDIEDCNNESTIAEIDEVNS